MAHITWPKIGDKLYNKAYKKFILFLGKFKEQASSTSMWLPVPTKDVPDPRPGSCVDDTRELPDNVLNFIRYDFT